MEFLDYDKEYNPFRIVSIRINYGNITKFLGLIAAFVVPMPFSLLMSKVKSQK